MPIRYIPLTRQELVTVKIYNDRTPEDVDSALRSAALRRYNIGGWNVVSIDIVEKAPNPTFPSENVIHAVVTLERQAVIHLPTTP